MSREVQVTRHSTLLWLAGFSGHVASFRPCQAARTEKSQEMWAMRLTRKGHHRKLRAPIRDISYWLMNACRVFSSEDSSTLRTSTIIAASHDYLLPPTTTCCQPPVPRCACLEKDLDTLPWIASTACDRTKGTMNT